MFRKAGIGFVALAMLAPGLASALGVGDYQLSSYLNQPLKMTVALTDIGDLSSEEILVTLAAQKDFDSAGVDRIFFLSDLEFEVEVDGEGSGLLTIRSTQPVREPYLDFLVEVLWPQGRILREYTVLLDPPTYAEEIGSVQPAPATAAASEPVAAQPVQQQPAPQPVQSASAPAPVQAPAPASAPAAEPVSREEYVVQSQDTMWRIALNTRPSRSISVQQMMLSIQELNPDAFIDGNVNLVREGTVLRLPTEAEVRGISARQALSEMADQNRRWRDKLKAMGIAIPTRAQVGSSAGSEGRVAGGDEGTGKVTLVSPEAATGTSGGGSGTGGKGSAELENEIAIREENIDQLRRENDELSSRLQDLQGQVETSDKLLQLRNDQIAKLQEELRKLQEAQGIEPSEPLLTEQELAAQAAGTDAGGKPVEGSKPGAVQGTGAAGQPGTAPGSTGGEVATSEGAAAPTSEGGAPAAGGGGAGTPIVVDPNAIKEYGRISAQPTGDPDLDMLLESDTGGPLPPELAAVMEGNTPIAPGQIQLAPGALPAPGAAGQPAAGAAGAEGGTGAEGTEAQADTGLMGAVRDNLVALLGVLVALALLIVALIFFRNRQKAQAEQQQQSMAAMDGADEDFFVDNIDDSEVEGTFEGEELDAPEDSAGAPTQDPLEQVDVYVAYGRHAEALNLLRHEIGQAPERSDLKVRLLEVLVEMNDRDGFEQEAAKHAGDADVDARARALRASLEGGVADGPSLDDLEMDLTADDGDDDGDATLVLDATGQQDSVDDDEFGLDLDVAGGDDEGGLDLDLEVDSSGSDDEDGLDLDLDLGGDDSKDDGGLDDLEFSLDDDSGSSDTASADSTEEFSLSLDGDDEGGELDLDLGGDSSEGGLDLDLGGTDDGEMELDLDDVSLDDASDEFQETAEAPASEELDLSLDDLGDEGADEDATLTSMPALDEAPSGATEQREAFSLDDADDTATHAAATDMRSAVDVSAAADDDDFDFLGDTDENATKLDLAKAYIDMGDSEGARDILNEVIAQGSDAQQQEAKDLLSQVG